ncbi:MAG: HdeD family acid-resistance protein [Gemmataceae bacterium]|nr:HdeD family acid-resistance protein [Gemmataceae bacterium]
MTQASPASAPGTTEHVRLQGTWLQLVLLGAVSFFLGLLAISSTFVATMATVFAIGIVLVVAGVTEVVHAILVRNWGGFALHLLSAAMYLILGVFMLEDPVQAAAVLTLIFAASFIVGGVLRIIFALTERFPSWPWVLLSGAVDLLLGLMIFNRWPDSSLWVIGLFVGLDLLLHGWSSIILGLTVRTVARP